MEDGRCPTVVVTGAGAVETGAVQKTRRRCYRLPRRRCRRRPAGGDAVEVGGGRVGGVGDIDAREPMVRGLVGVKGVGGDAPGPAQPK